MTINTGIELMIHLFWYIISPMWLYGWQVRGEFGGGCSPNFTGIFVTFSLSRRMV
jgi:hypothetical protein